MLFVLHANTIGVFTVFIPRDMENGRHYSTFDG